MVKFLILMLMFITAHADKGLKGQNHLLPGENEYNLIIKFSPDYVRDVDQGKLYFSDTKNIPPRDNSFLLQHTYRQVISYSQEEKQKMRQGITLPPRGNNSFNAYAFRGMVYLEGAPQKSTEELLALAEKFEDLPFVEYAALEPVDPPPPPSVNSNSAANIPDFTGRQFYRKYNHGNDTIGINIDYAWGRGIEGQGVRIADIEWGFDYDHVDLTADNFIELVPTTDHQADDHGTAVAGVMVSHDNGFGVTGMVHDADVFYGISEITRDGRVGGIAEGLEVLRTGDIFLYEMQTGGQNGEYVPADYNQAVWDITQQATDAGIIVVAAAGNGGENLDDSFYNSYNARGDNGSIIVGAGTIRGRNRAGFSTYGSRVNVQGWGDGSVTTTGYGPLHNSGPHETYTHNFSGTSSATPIVASAVVAIQSFAKTKLDLVLSPREMRQLLIETGTTQGSGWGTGNTVPQPNVQAAIEKLEDDHDTNPTYTLNLVSENGSVITNPDGSSFEEGTEVELTAKPDFGYSFTGWSGDISGSDTPITIIMDSDKTVTANFEIGAVEGDNLSGYLGWYTYTDEHGSSIDTAGGFISDDSVVTLTFDMVAEDGENDIWPYGALASEIATPLVEPEFMFIEYRADQDFNLVLPMATVSQEGAYYRAPLPGTDGSWNQQIIQLASPPFTQPEWADETPFDKTIVESIEITPDFTGTAGELSIRVLMIDGYTVDQVPVQGEDTQSASGAIMLRSSTPEGIGISVPETGRYDVRAFTIDGRQIGSITEHLNAGTNTVSISGYEKISSNLILLQVSGEGFSRILRVNMQ
ncbi:MAG: S8 family serine peptidase [Fibrobacterota bacterium]